MFDPKKIKAVGIDIDGTLINSQEICTPRTEATIKNLIKTGRKIFIVTGRSTSAAISYARQIGLEDYMITYNGACIYDLRQNKTIRTIAVGLQEAKGAIHVARNNRLLVLAFADDICYYEQENEILPQYLKRLNGQKMETIFGSLDDAPMDRFVKILLLGYDKEIMRAYKELKDLHDENIYAILTTPGFRDPKNPDTALTCIEVMSCKVNKGKTLEYLLEQQGIRIHEALAFGDDNNDIEMLSMVGWGVAMDNAKEAVKICSNDITLSNDQDGVADFIEKKILF